MCSIIVGIVLAWTELCGNRAGMGKISAGRGGDWYELSHACKTLNRGQIVIVSSAL